MVILRAIRRKHSSTWNDTIIAKKSTLFIHWIYCFFVPCVIWFQIFCWLFIKWFNSNNILLARFSLQSVFKVNIFFPWNHKWTFRFKKFPFVNFVVLWLEFPSISLKNLHFLLIVIFSHFHSIVSPSPLSISIRISSKTSYPPIHRLPPLPIKLIARILRRKLDKLSDNFCSQSLHKPSVYCFCG